MSGLVGGHAPTAACAGCRELFGQDYADEHPEIDVLDLVDKSPSWWRHAFRRWQLRMEAVAHVGDRHAELWKKAKPHGWRPRGVGTP